MAQPNIAGCATKSAVAGIVDRAGKMRVVIGPRQNMPAHVGPGERAFVLPARVREPVPFGKPQADLIDQVQRHITAQKKANACGDCKQCCKTLYINEGGLKKASHTWCPHSDGGGCAIYKKRPEPCKSFKCLWLQSQETLAPMGADLRPDKCGAIFTDDTTKTDPALMEVHIDGVMTPQALAFIDNAQQTGRKAKRITHYIGEK